MSCTIINKAIKLCKIIQLIVDFKRAQFLGKYFPSFAEQLFFKTLFIQVTSHCCAYDINNEAVTLNNYQKIFSVLNFKISFFEFKYLFFAE